MPPPEKPKPKLPEDQNKERERLQREAEELRRKAEAVPDNEESKKAQALLAATESRLQALEPKKPHGFARLPEKTKEQEYLEALTGQEKLALLQDVLKAKPKTPEQKFSLFKLSFLLRLAERLASYNRLQLQEVLGNFHVQKRLREKYRDKLKNPKMLLPSEGQKFLGEEFKKPAEWFRQHGEMLFANIIGDEHFDLSHALPPDVKEILETYGTGQKLENLKDETVINQYYARFIFDLRKEKRYEEAQDFMEGLLAEEFEKGKKMLSPQELEHIRSQQKVLINRSEWKNQGMTDQEIDAYVAFLLQIQEERAIKQIVAERFLGKAVGIPKAKQAIWEQYNDMLDPKREWANLEDKTWDTIYQELLINAPLIVASGGVAAAGRAAISAMTKNWIAREGVKRFPLLLGKKFAERTLLSTVISQTAATGAGLAVEGALFEVTHGLLTFDIVRSLPEWGRSILWSALTLGAFHGSGRLAERAFTKTRHGVLLQTKLGKLAETLAIRATGQANKAVYEAIKSLALKGHVEAATMLFIGAAQNIAYEGNLDEFFENIGDEILHAYISIGALKISGKLAERVQRRIAERRAKRKFEEMPTAPAIQPAQSSVTPESSPTLSETSSERVQRRIEARKRRAKKQENLRRAEKEVPDEAIKGPLNEALSKPGYREVTLGSRNIETVRRHLKLMIQQRPGEFEFLNREFRNLPIEMVRAIVLGHGVDVTHANGIVGRAYGGKTVGEGGMGIVKEGIFISADGKFSQRVVIKKMYFTRGTDRRAIETGAAFERRVADFMIRLARENPNYPETLLRPIGVSEHAILFEKIGFERGEAVSLRAATDQLSTQQIKQVIQDAVTALHFLHEQGILHSDVKPTNIMLRAGPGGSIQGVLIDLGVIAGTREGQPSYPRETGMLGGTPYFGDIPLYRQMTADNINLSADVYGIGQTILFVLGRTQRSDHPSRSDNTAEALVALANDCINWRNTGLTSAQILDRLRSIP